MTTRTHTPDIDKLSTNGMAGLIDRLREKSRIRTERVYVERWELEVDIRELSAKEIRDLRAYLKDRYGREDIDNEQAAIRMIALSCYHPGTDERMFTVADLALLVGDDMSIAPINSLAARITRLNGLGEDGVKNAENSFPDTEGRE